MTRFRDNVHARATIDLAIGVILCCALTILILTGFGTALGVVLQRWDLWLGLAAILLSISILYAIVRRAASTEE